MKKQAKKPKSLNHKQFINVLIQEIEPLTKSNPYHSFVLMACLCEYARMDLGINIFKDARINKGFHYLLHHYRPQGLWFIHMESKKEKHKGEYKKRLVLHSGKTLLAIKTVLSKANPKK